MVEKIINFDDPIKRSEVLAWARTVRGTWRMGLARFRKRRSDRQNRMLWGCVYPHVASGLFEAWGETVSNDEVHEMMKDRFLRTRSIVDHRTGEIKAAIAPSTAALSTVQFSEYVEKIARFAAEELGVVVPSPGDLMEAM